MPGELQKVLTDLHFNIGGVTPKNWPGLNKAIQNRDKEAIIRETHRQTKHEDRNQKTREFIEKIDMPQWD